MKEGSLYKVVNKLEVFNKLPLLLVFLIIIVVI